MRPLHSLLVVVALAALAGVCWLALGGEESRPEVAGVAPVPTRSVEQSEPEVQLDRPDALAATEPVAQERVAITAEPTPAPAPEQPQGPRLLGTVLDPSGQPVAGARVLAAASEGMGFEQPLDAGGASPWRKVQETTTDAAGHFDVAGLHAGGVRIAVRAAGFAPHDAGNLLLPAGGAHTLEPISLQPSVVLSGRVVTEDGKGVEGAEIVRLAEHRQGFTLGGPMAHAGALLATTAADGFFSIDQLASGSFSLKVAHEDHPDRVEAGKTYAVGERVDGLTIVMERGQQIHGRVLDVPAGSAQALFVSAVPHFGDEQGNYTVTTMGGSDGAFAAENRRAELKPDGSFILRGLREGLRYSIDARRENQAQAMGFVFSPSLSPRVVADAGERGVELTYQPEGAFLFQVVDSRTGEPVTDYVVEAGTGWMMALRGDNGRVAEEHPEGRGRFGNLRPKTDDVAYKLRIKAVGYRAETLTGLAIRAGQEFDLGIISIEPVPLVRVVVTDRATGAAIRGARVTLAIAEEELGGPGGRFTMRQTMDIDLGSGDGDAHPEPQVVLGGDDTRVAVTDEDGLALLTSFPGERSVVSVGHRDFAAHRGTPFVPSTTSDEQVAVSLSLGGSVTVTLLTPSGDPLAGSRVDHRAPDEDELMGTVFGGGGGKNVTDSEGRVTFAHLAPGTHAFRPAGAQSSFSFSGAGGDSSFRIRRSGESEGPRDPSWEEVAVSEGSSAEVALTAPVRVSVEGRIFEAGLPLEGATVALLDERAAGRDPMMSMFGQQNGPEARTDAKGYYKVENVTSGEYTVRITHPDRHMPAEYPLVLGDEARFLDLDLTVSIVEGKVTDESGKPLEGVSVWPELVKDDGAAPRAMMVAVMVTDDGGGGENSVVSMSDGGLGGNRAVTDSNGNYSLRGIRDGLEVVIKAEGGAVKPGSSEVFTLAPGEHQQSVDLTLGAAGKLEIVAELASGKPASNMIVIAVWAGPEEESQDRKTGFMRSGSTTLDGLTPGPWSIEVRGVGGLGGDEEVSIPEQVVEVVAGETVTVTFEVP